MYREITDWSEVWALLIPLFCLFRQRNHLPYLKPARIYVVVALAINIFATLIHKFKIAWGLTENDFLWSNNFLYNLHSIVRFALFSWFFILLDQRFMKRIKKLIPVGFAVFVLINFIFLENFFNRGNLSSRLLATEAALLLFYCLQYFISIIIDERAGPVLKEPGAWLVTGLTFYVAANFFIFLFYDYLILHAESFAIEIWDVHNLAYLFLCICLAISFYKKDEE